MDVDALRMRAAELIDRGASAEAVATLETAAAQLAVTDAAGAAQLLVEASTQALHSFGPDRAVEHARRAVALAGERGGIALRVATVRLGDALSWAGRYAEAGDAWRAATPDADEDQPQLLAERANAMLRLGDPRARDAALRALVAARTLGDATTVADTLLLVAIAEVRGGRLKEALAAAEELLATAPAGSMDALNSLGLLAWLLALLGDEAGCRARIAEANRGLEDRRITAPGGLALGMLCLSLGRAAEAVAAFESKLAEPRIGPVAAMTMLRPFGAELVEAYARAGRLEQGRRVLAAILPVALGTGQPRLVAPTRRAQGILEDDEDAFVAALDAHAGWENRFEAARTRLAYGELLRRRRRRAEARDQLERAAADFAHVGAVLWRERALAELRLAGDRLPARRPVAIDGPETLTRQEGEIVELLRAGRSNREIAERLVLSVKTVEGHLTTIYGKLGVASRAQALVALSASGEPAGREPESG